MYLTPFQESYFPNLHRSDYRLTSPETDEYNCFAWAAHINDNRWDPTNNWYWPIGVPRSVTLPSAQAAYESLGFELCTSDALENGYEKIAIYVKDDGQLAHAARQLANGSWTSKLGDWPDIEHATLTALEGSYYGHVEAILRRHSDG